MSKKIYLGDGAYAEVTLWANGAFDLVLTTENGIETTNRIVLEPEVLKALQEYLDAVRAHSDAPER